MRNAGKTYTTFNKVRLALFTRSYAHHSIAHYLKAKYKIDGKLKPKEIRKQYFNKNTIPGITRLSKTLNLNYTLLWKSILLNKNQSLSKHITDKEKIKIYLSIENELILLAIAKRKKSDYTDPDYEDESGFLTTAIERAIGNALTDVGDDFAFAQQSEELKENITIGITKLLINISCQR